MAQKDIHSLIQCNLQQLHFLQPILFPFKEGMFRVPNIKGFQYTMHYLLNIVEPVKCAKMLPWPLLEKKAESQFRIAVKKLLIEINDAYPEANLPKIFTSFLMTPGGEKFAHFMWKLTKFVLFKSLCQTYGTSDVLLPPRTFGNDTLASSKLNLLQTVTESTTQKAIANQFKIDSLLSQECERQCSVHLSELEEEVKKYEKLLKELVKDSPAPAEIKEKLYCNLENNDVVTKWVADVETEGRVIEAIIHVLNKTGISLTNCIETIKLAENNGTSQLCLSPNGLNIPAACKDSLDDDLKELMNEMQDGKLSLSELIQSLIRSQVALIHQIDGKGLQDMIIILPELHGVNVEFQECENLFSTVETKLRETLYQVQNNYETLWKDFRTSKSKPIGKVEVPSSIIPVPTGTIDEDVYITDQTPVRGVRGNICNKETGSYASGNIELDPQLLQTPELNRELKSPVYAANISGTRKEYETPACKNIFTLPTTTSKKLRATDLVSLTSSLVKKKKVVEMTRQFQSRSSLSVGRKVRATPTISKDLFCQFTEGIEEASTSTISQTGFKRCLVNIPGDKFSHVPANLYENESSTHHSADDCFNDINEGDQDFFPFSESEDDVTSSPASLLCSTTPTELEPHTNKKQNRRKSLDSIIQRYLKIRQNMNP